MKYKVVVFISAIFFLNYGSQAQTDSAGRKISYEYSYLAIDTLKFRSRKVQVLHTLIRTREMNRKLYDVYDSIFSYTANKFSKLYITDGNLRITEKPTIPIDNIIIDDSLELIIGLSRSITSAYQIVLYNFKGELLFKKHISPFELVLDNNDYKQFQNSFPDFFKYVNDNNQILQEGNVYYVDLAYWRFLSEEQKSKIKAKKMDEGTTLFAGSFYRMFRLSFL